MNSSKRRAATSSGTPGPVSTTAISTSFPRSARLDADRTLRAPNADHRVDRIAHEIDASPSFCSAARRAACCTA
jgi:hypothetical protein